MGPEEMERFARVLARFRPRIIRGYASALVLFSRHLQSRPHPLPEPVGIISCAETLTDPMRQEVERAFGATVFDRYGSREFGVIASQCERGMYHVNTRGVYVEILDGRRPAAPGSAGRVVITGLASRAMPLIRYDTGDVAEVPVEGRCGCGRGLPLIGRVYGRAADFIAAPDGRLVHGEFFTHLFYGRDCVREFALHQDTTGALLLSVVGEGETLQTQLEEVVEAIHERLGGQVSLSVQLVPRIEPSRSGKHCFVRSDAATALWAAGALSATAGDR
jgi:phenylacetate-CoA ligase